MQALSLVTKAQETDQADGAIVYLRARILFQMQRTEEALREAACAFALGEAGDPLLRLWIQAAKETGREAEALPAYALLIERHPDAVDVLLSYIQLLVQHDIPAALAAIDRSLPFVKDDAVRRVLDTIHHKLTCTQQGL